MNSKHIYIFDSCLEDYSDECFIFVASALKLSNRKKIQPVCLTKIVSENINNFTYFFINLQRALLHKPVPTLHFNTNCIRADIQAQNHSEEKSSVHRLLSVCAMTKGGKEVINKKHSDTCKFMSQKNNLCPQWSIFHV